MFFMTFLFSFTFWLWVQKLQKVLSGVPEAGLVSYILSIHPHRKRSSPVTVPFHEDESFASPWKRRIMSS